MVYEKNWAEYRKRRKLFWIIFLTYLPGVAIIGAPLGQLFKSETSYLIVAIIWMCAFAVSGLRFSFWKCPRCEKCFSLRWHSSNPFTSRCLHCGLAKWELSDTRSSDELSSDQFHCFKCGSIISESQTTCSKCGWSWSAGTGQTS